MNNLSNSIRFLTNKVSQMLYHVSVVNKLLIVERNIDFGEEYFNLPLNKEYNNKNEEKLYLLIAIPEINTILDDEKYIKKQCIDCLEFVFYAEKCEECQQYSCYNCNEDSHIGYLCKYHYESYHFDYCDGCFDGNFGKIEDKITCDNCYTKKYCLECANKFLTNLRLGLSDEEFCPDCLKVIIKDEVLL